jgi:ABC-2 type transport system ATP-binding protein
MMMIAGLLIPDSGSVELDGRALDSRNRGLRTLLGIVPQDLAIYPDLTARENLLFFGRLYGLSGRTLDERIVEALQRTGLASRADDLVGEFSGGMKRRLNFGVALLHRPRLLILDEPTVGVDPQSRSHLLECVRDLSQAGVAAIYASHYMEEVQSLCHRAAIIDHGKVLACDSLGALLARLTSDVTLRVGSIPPQLAEDLRGVAEISPFPEAGCERTIVISGGNKRLLNMRLKHVFALLDQNGVELESVNTEEPNLERLFLQLTGYALRD